MNYYSKDINELYQMFKTNKNGLKKSEAKLRVKANGKNIIVGKNKESKLKKFLKEFADIMIIILIISAIVSFVISYINHESYIDSIVILAIVILNALMGYIQELKADKAIDALKKMQSSKVKVKRDNNIYLMDSKYVTIGDILVLEAGDKVPADARIIYEAALKVDESSLTGESEPVLKKVGILKDNLPIQERSNMIFSGTNIVYGKCEALVCKVGMDTEFGHIANSLNEKEEEKTPLEKKINDISKFLSIIITIIICVMFIIGLIKGQDFKEILLLSISLAVAAIPEGLPAVITISLSLGMSEMAKKNAIVRKMTSIETLGCTEIICTDKTGTITQNKMKVQEIYYNHELKKIDTIDNNLLLKIMVLNNDALKNNDEYLGDPTEIALLEASEKHFDVEKIRKENIRIDEVPFDSDRKMMSTINKHNEDIILYTKGSFDSIISHCKYIYEDEKEELLTDEKRNILRNVEALEANKAFRVLAFAYKKISTYKLDENLENDLVFVGMTSLIDPPREDVKKAIELCKKAHIKPIMITGDSLKTALAISKDIGILENDDEAILGEELDKMDFETISKNVSNYSLYARVSPTNKLTIVNAWQKNNKIVAMTGDGVNDAPALKKADIGVGMGITGTEVSKSVSDIILADDSFSTIVTAIKEGRKIFDNIRNVLVYLLTGNIAEVLIVFIGMLFGIQIFLPIQILYINLITDSIPAIALSFEKEEHDIMTREIRKKNSSFFTPFLLAKIFTSALLKASAIIAVYFINLKLYDIKIASTMAFLTIILLEIIFTFSCRNIKRNVIGKNLFNNKYINQSIIVLILINIVLFLTPLKNIFDLVFLNPIQLIYCIAVAITIFLVDELSKKYIKKLFKD